MATSSNDPFKNLKEHPSTYIVQDRSNEEEIQRLQIQDRLFTELVGGVLPEQPDPTRFESVLDVACGTGGWLIEVAKTYPHIARLVGVDVSAKMIDHARAQAEAAGMSGRVHFQTGDALRALDFPKDHFDLVNLRFGISWVRKWDWPGLISEFQRVARPEGIVRITESSTWQCNLPATARILEFSPLALHAANHLFEPGPRGVIDYFPQQMSKYGIMDVKTKEYSIAFHKDPETLRTFAEDLQIIARTAAPFVKKWVKFSEDYDTLYKQMVQEMERPDFEATGSIVTAWGEAFKPGRG